MHVGVNAQAKELPPGCRMTRATPGTRLRPLLLKQTCEFVRFSDAVTVLLRVAASSTQLRGRILRSKPVQSCV